MNYIAERKLLYSEKGDHIKKEITIKISSPYIVKQDDVDFPVDGVIAACKIEFEGLPKNLIEIEEVHGADSIQKQIRHPS